MYQIFIKKDKVCVIQHDYNKAVELNKRGWKFCLTISNADFSIMTDFTAIEYEDVVSKKTKDFKQIFKIIKEEVSKTW